MQPAPAHLLPVPRPSSQASFKLLLNTLMLTLFGRLLKLLYNYFQKASLQIGPLMSRNTAWKAFIFCNPRALLPGSWAEAEGLSLASAPPPRLASETRVDEGVLGRWRSDMGVTDEQGSWGTVSEPGLSCSSNGLGEGMLCGLHLLTLPHGLAVLPDVGRCHSRHLEKEVGEGVPLWPESPGKSWCSAKLDSSPCGTSQSLSMLR